MRTMKAAIVVAVALAIVSLHEAEATRYNVGDSLGWTIPPGGAATYAAWAAKYSFVVKDMFDFKFNLGEQDLAILNTAGDYESCNTTKPAYVFQEPVTIRFLDSSTYYFTSTLANHCAKGQKIALHIGHPVSPSPSPNPYPSNDHNSPSADHPKFVAHRIDHIYG